MVRAVNLDGFNKMETEVADILQIIDQRTVGGDGSGNLVSFNPADSQANSNGNFWQVLNLRSATYIPLGDSRVSNGAQDSGASQINDASRGSHNHWQTILQGRIIQLRNAGLSGDNTTGMLARLQTDVIAYNPGLVTLEGPVNDINAVATGSTPAAVLALMKSNVKAIYRALYKAGIIFATSTIAPWASTGPTWTPTQQGVHSAYNRWVKAWCQSLNIPCADVFETNASLATNTFVANTAYDVSGHYSDWGAFLAAMAWVKVLDPIIPKNSFFVSRNNDYDNLIYDGGGAWAVGGAAPATWTVGGTNITAQATSVVARTDNIQGTVIQTAGTAAVQNANIIMTRASVDLFGTAWAAGSAAFTQGKRCLANDGNQYRATSAAGTTGGAQPVWNSEIGALTVDNTVTWERVSNFAVGDTVFAEMEVFLSGISGGTLGCLPQLTVQHNGAGGNLAVLNSNDGATRVPPYPAGYYVLRSRPYVILAGCLGITANLVARFDNAVAFTIQMGRIAYRHFPAI